MKRPTPRKPGRPPSANPRGSRLVVLVTTDERRTVETAAKRERVSVAEWVRAALTQRLGREAIAD